ncbi:MAG: MBL fold metallo-hydrolase [Leucobacter sp.]
MNVLPEHRSKLPYFYPRKFGDGTLTVLSDGPLDLGDPRESFLGQSPEIITQMLRDNFLPEDNVVLEQNIPLFDINGMTILFDTGMGDSKMFGPNTGRLLTSLEEAGRSAEEVDAVVLSHAHIDHAGGVADAEGRLAFPNADIYISERDFGDWTDGSSIPDSFSGQIAMARRNLLPHKERTFFFKDGESFLPGVQAMSTPGHTLGHMSFLIESEGDTICFMGDLTHHSVLLLERPMMQFKYDADPELSARSRTRTLDMLAKDGIQVMSYHFSWPGVGHVVAEGKGFRYLPAPMQLLKD